MSKKFTVTINSATGVRQYDLHQFIIKVFKYVVAIILIIVLITIASIFYLKNEVSNMQIQKLEIEMSFKNLQGENVELFNKNKNLNVNIAQAQGILIKKREELSSMSDSLKEIEELIGISPADEKTIQERIDITKLSSQDMITLLQFIPNGSPIEYKGITSKYGYRIHPTLNRKEFHRGSDMRAKMNTPVYATADGIVEFAGYHKKSGYGRLVILKHNYGFKSYFGHLKKVVVKSNSFVRKGELIAYTGNSGMSSGPHLHYEVRFMYRPLNPFWFIKWNIKNYNKIFQKEKKVPWQSLIKATSQIKVINPTQAPLSSQ